MNTCAAALPRLFPSLPTEIWLEICGYLSYGELVTVIGRLSRYHRELLASPSLDEALFRKAVSEEDDKQLFRKAISEEDERFLPDPGGQAMATHPLLSKIVWIGGRDDFYLAHDTTTPVTALQIPASSEHATSPPVASLLIQFTDHMIPLDTSLSRLVHRSMGVTVKDVLAIARDFVSIRPSVEVSNESGYPPQDTVSTLRHRIWSLDEGEIITIWSYAHSDFNGAPHTSLFMLGQM